MVKYFLAVRTSWNWNEENVVLRSKLTQENIYDGETSKMTDKLELG